jgi:hypothetical protein
MEAVNQLEDKGLAGLTAHQAAVQRGVGGGGGGGGGGASLPTTLQHQAQVAHYLISNKKRSCKNRFLFNIPRKEY